MRDRPGAPRGEIRVGRSWSNASGMRRVFGNAHVNVKAIREALESQSLASARYPVFYPPHSFRGRATPSQSCLATTCRHRSGAR